MHGSEEGSLTARTGMAGSLASSGAICQSGGATGPPLPSLKLGERERESAAAGIGRVRFALSPPLATPSFRPSATLPLASPAPNQHGTRPVALTDCTARRPAAHGAAAARQRPLTTPRAAGDGGRRRTDRRGHGRPRQGRRRRQGLWRGQGQGWAATACQGTGGRMEASPGRACSEFSAPVLRTPPSSIFRPSLTLITAGL